MDFFLFVFATCILSCLCNAALWSPAGEVSPVCDLSLSDTVSWVRCVFFVSIPDLCLLPYFYYNKFEIGSDIGLFLLGNRPDTDEYYPHLGY